MRVRETLRSRWQAHQTTEPGETVYLPAASACKESVKARLHACRQGQRKGEANHDEPVQLVHRTPLSMVPGAHLR